MEGDVDSEKLGHDKRKDLRGQMGEAREEAPGLTDWALWQLLDSLLPVGGFTNSYGLEAAAQAGLVRTTAELEEFCLAALESAGAMYLPFVLAAGRGWWGESVDDEADRSKREGSELCEVDETGAMKGLLQSRRQSRSRALDAWADADALMSAFLTNHVARRASCSQGSALLRVATSTFPDVLELKEMRQMCRVMAVKMQAAGDELQVEDRTPGHHATAFGAVCAAVGVQKTVCQRAFLFMTLRDIMSAATRLNLIGPLEAAKVQHKLSKAAEKVLAWAIDRPISDVHQTAPLWDLVQGAHDELFARLFRT